MIEFENISYFSSDEDELSTREDNVSDFLSIGSESEDDDTDQSSEER